MQLGAERAHPLASVDLFRSLSCDDLASIERQIRIRQCKAGHTIVGYQDDSRDVFFILAGRLKVTIFSEAGREVSFRELSAGQSFGELSAIDGQPRSANVIALTDAMVGSMTAADFMLSIRKHPDLAVAVLQNLTRLVRLLSERVQGFSDRVSVRICNELLRLARENMTGPGTARIRPAPKHAEIASRCNTHREAVSRELSILTKRQIIVRGRGELVIKDVAALIAYIQQLPGK